MFRLLRFTNPEIAFGFTLASILWIGVAAWQGAHAPFETGTFWQTTDPVAFFTLVLSISTFGFWIVTWQGGKRQSRDMTESIDVAERAVVARERVANEQVASERAWIKVDIAPAGNLTITDNTNIILPLAFVVTNCGNSPATNVRVYSYLMMKHPGPNKSRETYRRFSEEVRTRGISRRFDNSSSYTLFPNQTRTIHASNFVMRQQVEEATVAWSETVEEQFPYYQMLMVGVVAYSSPFDTEQHQTGFSVDIKCAENASPSFGHWGFFRIDRATVPMSEIDITPSGGAHP
jgi:hypothetical protein